MDVPDDFVVDAGDSRGAVNCGVFERGLHDRVSDLHVGHQLETACGLVLQRASVRPHVGEVSNVLMAVDDGYHYGKPPCALEPRGWKRAATDRLVRAPVLVLAGRGSGSGRDRLRDDSMTASDNRQRLSDNQ